MTEHHLATLAVRAGQSRTHEGEHSEPIFTTSSYVFASAAEAAARFDESAKGNIYSRFTNPTVRCFEERLAAMEGAAACVATGSGMAAILATCMALHEGGRSHRLFRQRVRLDHRADQSLPGEVRCRGDVRAAGRQRCVA